MSAGGIESAKTHRIQRLREENRRLRKRLAATDLAPHIEALDEARRVLASVAEWQDGRMDSQREASRPGEGGFCGACGAMSGVTRVEFKEDE